MQGISLSVDQFNNLVKSLPQIEKALSRQGEKIDRPNYESTGGSAADDGVGEEEMVVEKQATAKRNFEETSEEE